MILFGYIVELVFVQLLDIYLKQYIFKFLGMYEMIFFVNGEDLDCLMINYVLIDLGLQEIENCENIDYKDKNCLFDGGGVLVGSVSDYFVFVIMLVNKGCYYGKQFLLEVLVNSLFIF